MSPREPGPPATDPRATLILGRADVHALLDVAECTTAVEHAFRALGEGSVAPPGVLATEVPGGGFHVKTAAMTLGAPYYVAKVNANFPANREQRGLPTIQGVLALFDGRSGELLALMDSIEITSTRTAAATAVAAKYLARADSGCVAVIGCGEQGRAQLRALARVLPIRSVHAVDVDAARAAAYAREMSRELGLDVRSMPDARRAAAESDVCVTCTTARTPVLRAGDVPPGAFVAAVGADNPHKHEIDAALLAASVVVVDLLEQCATIGDLHHALAEGVMVREQVHAELGEIVAGRKAGRRGAAEVIVFDSTGTALQDVAAAALVYEKALRAGRGRLLPIAGPGA